MADITKRSPFFRDSRKTKSWSIRDVVEHFNPNKTFEEVVKEQKAKGEHLPEERR